MLLVASKSNQYLRLEDSVPDNSVVLKESLAIIIQRQVSCGGGLGGERPGAGLSDAWARHEAVLWDVPTWLNDDGAVVDVDISACTHQGVGGNNCIQ